MYLYFYLWVKIWLNSMYLCCQFYTIICILNSLVGSFILIMLMILSFHCPIMFIAEFKALHKNGFNKFLHISSSFINNIIYIYNNGKLIVDKEKVIAFSNYCIILEIYIMRRSSKWKPSLTEPHSVCNWLRQTIN